MTEEDYLAWKDHPVTQWVLEAYSISAEMCRDMFMGQAWDNVGANETPRIDNDFLAEMWHKSVAFRSMNEATFDDLKARHDERKRD